MFGIHSLRRTAGATLFFFVWMIQYPALAAAVQPTPVTASAPSSVKQDPNTLEALRDTAQRARAKAERGEDSNTEESQLLQSADALDKEQRQAEAEFADIGKHLETHHLPNEIKQRHAEAVADYRSKMKALKARVNDFKAAHTRRDKIGTRQRLSELSDFLDKAQKHRHQQPFDPNNLPFSSPSGKVRAPKEKRQELEDIVRPPQTVSLAANELTPGLLAAASPSAAPTPDDLAETEDVQLSQAIKDQAAALNNNPVDIYNFVRNTIEFLPTYGSIQGSDLTLQTQRGNAFDTASLLIALLRAANVPARYADGTVQIPIDQVMNWVGGVTNPMAALELLGQGGIPNTGITQGGVIKSVKLEHVWVEAFVYYIPSRGAKHKVGDTWTPLDASFKQYHYSDGMDIRTAIPFDAQGLLDQIKQSATVNEAEGSIQNIDQNLVQTTLTAYQTNIRTYIDSRKPNATVGDVLGDKTIIEQKFPILMGSLPYKLLVSGGVTATLAANLRHKIRLSLYGSSLDRSLDNPAMSFSASLPSLAGKRISFTYEPASSADQAVIDNAIAGYQTRLPAYLIRVKPTLKVEGEIVAEGGVYKMGENQVLSVDMIAPWYQHNRDYPLTSGDFHVLGLNPSGITAAAYDARSHQHDLSSMGEVDYRDYTAEMFHQIALAWWGEKQAFNDFIGATNHVVHYQLPSHTLAGSPLTVRYFFGIARSASYGSRVMDAKEDFITAAHAGGNVEQKRRFALAAGYVGSYLEAGIFDQAFLMDPGHSMSTITALKAASEKGVAIYSIDAANAASLNQIVTDPEDVQTMRNAVAAGLRVTTAQRDITVDNFTGLGYILEDPKTGAAAYLISGGRNGDNSPAGQTVYPLPQMPASPIFGIMLSSSLRSAGAFLVAEGGFITGIALPEVAVEAGAAAGEGSAGGPILAALMAALIIASSSSQAIEKRYPRISQIYRHYTTSFAKPLILASNTILASKDGDFGPGVYTEEPPDADITCPITQDEIIIIHDRYNFKAEPLRNSYVEIEITRAGYWDAVINEQLNSKNAVETIFRVPFLYFGPYSVAIEYHSDC